MVTGALDHLRSVLHEPAALQTEGYSGDTFAGPHVGVSRGAEAH